MSIPTEPISSIPRPADLLAAIDAQGGVAQDPALEPLYEAALIRDRIKPHHRVFVGVISPIDPRVETPEEVKIRSRVRGTALAAQELGLSDVH
jgi:hypothetical protein